MNLVEDLLPPCKVCKRVWKRGDSDKWVYYDGEVVCLHHHGIKEWYQRKLEEAQKSLDNSTTF